MINLTEQQFKIFDVIKGHVNDYGYPPTRAEIAKIMGFNLVWKGLKSNEHAIDKNTKKIIIKKNNDYFRPSDVLFLKGDAKKARKNLGWEPKVKFKDLVKIMVESDKKRSLKGRILQ